MNIRVYSMFDRKARAFGALMAFVNDEVARRAMLDVLRGDGEITRFPGDFDLHFLGVMDTDTGIIDAGPPALVFNVGDLLEAQKEG